MRGGKHLSRLGLLLLESLLLERLIDGRGLDGLQILATNVAGAFVIWIHKGLKLLGGEELLDYPEVWDGTGLVP